MRPEQLTVDVSAQAVVGALSPVRDWEIVQWVGRVGAVTMDQLRVRFELGRTVAYRRVAACIEGKLLERVDLLRGQPALIRATRCGLRLTRLPIGIAQVPPELVGHWVACGWVAIALEREFGANAVRSEREIRIVERWEERLVASAKLSANPDGSDRVHRPDLAVVNDQGTIAVEVELTAKAPKRLESIVRAWRRARWVDSVRYYVADGPTRRGVERAVERLRAQDRLDVVLISDVFGLKTLADGARIGASGLS